jgi:REP element-mobilizing transposase RayT
MVQEPYILDAVRRKAVLSSIEEVCRYRGWTLLAANVRTNHVHVVTVADCKPEQVMVAFKA